MQPFHPLSSSSPPAFNLSQHQVFSSESALHIRWPKYWSFSFTISSSSEYSGLISFMIDWFDLLEVPGTLKSPLQHHISITADDDCSHEIKRHLLLGRKAMTNLNSILKSRGITLSTKVHIGKAMVFPVFMYGCESWTIKKAECSRIYAFERWCWRRLLRVPWTARRSKQIGRAHV